MEVCYFLDFKWPFCRIVSNWAEILHFHSGTTQDMCQLNMIGISVILCMLHVGPRQRLRYTFWILQWQQRRLQPIKNIQVLHFMWDLLNETTRYYHKPLGKLAVLFHRTSCQGQLHTSFFIPVCWGLLDLICSKWMNKKHYSVHVLTVFAEMPIFENGKV